MGKLTMNTGIGSWVLPVESIFQQDGVKALEEDASQGRGSGGQVHLGQIAHRSIGRYVRLPSPLGLLSIERDGIASVSGGLSSGVEFGLGPVEACSLFGLVEDS